MRLGTGAAIPDPFLEFPENFFPLGIPVGQNFPLAICYLKRVVRFSYNDPLRTPSPLVREKEENSYILIHQTAVIMEWGKLRKHCLYELCYPCQFMP